VSPWNLYEFLSTAVAGSQFEMVTDSIYRALRRAPNVQRQFKRVLVRLPRRRRQVMRFGQRLWVDPAELHGFHLYYEREYDDYIFKFLENRLGSFARALDIGANIGVYTCFLASRMDKVDAFEPEIHVLPKLRANLQLNGLTKVRIHGACVAHISGKVHFQPPDKANEGIGRIAEGAGVEYPSVSLNDFFGDSIGESCFIKMDIEGGEWLALQGAGRVLSHPRFPVSLLIEVHPEQIISLGGSVPGLKALLESMGFHVCALTPDGLQTLSAGLNSRFWWASSKE
jgi:FkbM family methyltransferase